MAAFGGCVGTFRGQLHVLIEVGEDVVEGAADLPEAGGVDVHEEYLLAGSEQPRFRQGIVEIDCQVQVVDRYFSVGEAGAVAAEAETWRAVAREDDSSSVEEPGIAWVLLNCGVDEYRRRAD